MEQRFLSTTVLQAARSRPAPICLSAQRWRAGASPASASRRCGSTSAKTPKPEHRQARPIGAYYTTLLSQPPHTSTTHPMSLDTPLQPRNLLRPLNPRASAATGLPVELPATSKSSQPTSSSAVKPLSKEDMDKIRADTARRASVVFGSPLAGPAAALERKKELAAKGTTIAGVVVPPKPEEPDHCCMSGCVNCVWDRYGEEVEEWVAAKKAADDALKEELEIRAPEGSGARERIEAAKSKEDDGAQAARDMEKDAFKDVPVGILEFMKQEKKLKVRQKARAQETKSA